MMLHQILLVYLAIVALVVAASTALSFPNSSMMLSGKLVAAPTGSQVCDYGPNTAFPSGVIGTDLTAAHFTHCALNADFTDKSGTTTSGGFIMNNKNTFINECKGTTTWGLLWFRYATGAGAGLDLPAPCNRISIADDGAGTNVLTSSFSGSDIVASGNQSTTHVGFDITWPVCGGCSSMAPALPNSRYVEVTYSLTSGMQNSSGVGNTPMASDEITFSQGGGEFLDYDFFEQHDTADSSSSPLYNSTSALDNYTAAVGCGGKCAVGEGWQSDPTHKHTWSNLVTWDGAHNVYACFYYDNTAITFQSIGAGSFLTYCGQFSGTPPIADMQTHDHYLWWFSGRFANWNTAGLATTNLNVPVTMNIYQIRVFTCITYQGSGNDCSATQAGGSIVHH